MKELENGIWNQWQADSYHQHSANLAKFLINYLPKDKPVYDFGCGNGYYLGELEKVGFKCCGFEGTQLNNFKCKNVLVADLTKPLGVELSKGSVICLEVIEHIDKKFEQILLNTITENVAKGGKLVFSWALTGQPGIGHVNCAEQSYAIEQIEKRGFVYDKGLTLRTRLTIEENTSWFQRTLILFDKK